MIKNRVFNHNKIKSLLNDYGFNRIGEDNYSPYVNHKNSVVAYYVEWRNTPEKKSGFVFIYKNTRVFAYTMDDIVVAYNEILNII